MCKKQLLQLFSEEQHFLNILRDSFALKKIDIKSSNNFQLGFSQKKKHFNVTQMWSKYAMDEHKYIFNFCFFEQKTILCSPQKTVFDCFDHFRRIF
jgi:hypothetical protein